MRIVVRGHHLPGRTFCGDEDPRENVHVALQVGRHPEGLVAGDAGEAEWRTDVTIVERDGLRDFRGPAVQGKRGARFLYLTWGEVDGPAFTMFRRAKLMLDHIPDLDKDPAEAIATVDLTDVAGGPTCGRLHPPYLRWEGVA